mmetsp:Transcript_624/g.1429  ORF Transcript_624/g.1429 Transcript_624/m.1429 type:complete len:222 (-) Transcript_624:1260-1925(-)
MLLSDLTSQGRAEAKRSGMARIISSVLFRMFIADRMLVEAKDPEPFQSRREVRKVSAALPGSDVKLAVIVGGPLSSIILTSRSTLSMASSETLALPQSSPAMAMATSPPRKSLVCTNDPIMSLPSLESSPLPSSTKKHSVIMRNAHSFPMRFLLQDFPTPRPLSMKSRRTASKPPDWMNLARNPVAISPMDLESSSPTAGGWREANVAVAGLKNESKICIT